MVVLLFVAFGLAAFFAVSLPRSPRLIGSVERSYGPVIPAKIHVDNLHSKDPETVLSALHWLNERKSPAGVDAAIELLKSPDDYIWLNAAHYIGNCERQEAIPYLIKALRHTAWRSDMERVQILQKLTGENFGKDFDQWQRWWLKDHPDFQFDWESHLGYSPRLPKTNTSRSAKSRGVEATHR